MQGIYVTVFLVHIIYNIQYNTYNYYIISMADKLLGTVLQTSISTFLYIKQNKNSWKICANQEHIYKILKNDDTINAYEGS